jgi:GGDEF domain-containing protein
MPPEFVEQLRLAARYGGTEFLNLLVEAAQAIAIRRNPKSLPSPIDPASVGKE